MNNIINEKNDLKNQKDFNNLFYFKLLLAIILSWVLVRLWGRVIDAIFYNYFKWNSTSVSATSFVAILFTGILLFMIYVPGKTSDTIKESMKIQVTAFAAPIELNTDLDS